MSINYVASMTGVYSKANEHLSVEDSNINIAMKQIYCVLPSGGGGSNAYFNEGTINKKDHLQFHVFPFIHAKQFDSIDLLRAGLGLHSFYPQRDPSNRDPVDDTAANTTSEPDLWAKVDADLQGQKPKGYCLEQRDIVYAFKSLPMALLSSMILSPMEGRSKNQPKRLHLQT
jgi:hypothetical protein